MKCTAVLLSYRRRQNIPPILDSLYDQPFIERVHLWDNGASELPNPAEFYSALGRAYPGIFITASPKNQYTLGRFFALRNAQCDLVATQDDDCIVNNWREIYEKAVAYPDRIVTAVKESHWDVRGDQGTLLGWGSIFPWGAGKALEKYERAYGHNEVLLRKADRILGLLAEKPPIYIHADITEFPDAYGPESLYRRPDHSRLTAQAMRHCAAILDARKAGPALQG